MPGGVYRLRLAKGTYPIGGTSRRFDNKDSVTSEKIRPTQYQNDTVVQNVDLAPKKEFPKQITTKPTPPPKSYARDGQGEGRIRGRQADKSSKHK